MRRYGDSVYGVYMEKTTNPTRRRNILWDEKVDEIAVTLAHEKKYEGGVSELLARLVNAEKNRKRGISHLHSKEAA